MHDSQEEIEGTGCWIWAKDVLSMRFRGFAPGERGGILSIWSESVLLLYDKRCDGPLEGRGI